MKKHLTYLLAILLTSFMWSCKTREDVATTNPQKDHNMVEPDQIKPDVDTRFQTLFFQAQSEKAIGNMEKAYALFEDCLMIEPGDAATHYELARMDAMNNRLTEALDHIKKAVAADENNPWYHLMLGDVYYNQQKFDLAYKEYKKVGLLNPDDPNIIYDQANALLSAGKSHEAIDLLDQLEAREGVSEALSLQKHQLYLQDGNVDLAGRELESLAKAFPLEPRYWGMLAQFFQRTGQNDRALKALETLRNCDPQNGQVHMQLSDYYASAGDEAKSFDELLLGFGSTDVSIDHKIGILLRFFNVTEFDLSKLPQAYQLLEITQKTHPTEAKSYAMYGDFLNRDKRSAEARDKYRKAIELDAARSAIWSELLLLESELKEWNAMESESSRAMELFPMMPEYYFYNGVANERLKNYSRAVESLQTGKELVVENDRLLSQFYSTLGGIYNSMGDFSKSDESYEAALKIDPDDVFTLNNYAYYLSLRKEKLERAAEMSKLTNEIEPNHSSFEDTYAWILCQQGKYAEALTWVTKAVDHGASTNGEVVEHWGDILFLLDRKEEAMEKWKLAATLDGASNLLSRKIAEQKIVN